MTLDSWLYPLFGGALIGLAASLLLLIRGRIFGVTGIIANALFEPSSNRKDYIAIIIGLMAGSWLIHLINPMLFSYAFKGELWMMIVAGLLVGYGTRLGSGCTSGHGICGLPRLSIRSLVAVCTFMVTGGITVYTFRHIFKLI